MTELDQSSTRTEISHAMRRYENNQRIEIYCVRVGIKLRIRIDDDHFIRTANCQFPRNLRIEGRRWTVPRDAITLRSMRNKWFYSISKYDLIELNHNIDVNGAITKVYGDDESDCVVCLDEIKTVVFSPCCHYACCSRCAGQLKTCPLCRDVIKNIVLRTDIM